MIAAFMALALSADFTVTEHQCSQMQPERDGIKCAIANIDGNGATLLIRIQTRGDPPPAKDKRIQYELRTVMDSFMHVGGTFMVYRVNLPNGKLMDRTCSRTRGRMTEQCEDWDKADKDLNPLFKALNP